MSEVKVSVIVPIYNVEKYLKQCVDSLVNQTLKDIEIILVDDESPDNCPVMCDEFAKSDKRIKVVHKKNGGLGFARNTGLEVAKGEYVAFIDSDDFVDIEMFEKLYNVAMQYGADEVRCGIKFYQEGKITERHDVDRLTVFSGKESVIDFMLDVVAPLPACKRDVKYMMSSCCCIHSRRVIEKNNIRFLSERQCLSEDLIWDIDLFPKMDCIVYIPECLYTYRENPVSLTHQYSIEKYKRIYTFFGILEKKLGGYLSKDRWLLHLYRSQMLYLRTAISGFMRNKKNVISNISYVLHDTFWDEMFANYPFHCLPTKHRIYFQIARWKNPWLMYLLERVRKGY